MRDYSIYSFETFFFFFFSFCLWDVLLFTEKGSRGGKVGRRRGGVAWRVSSEAKRNKRKIEKKKKKKPGGETVFPFLFFFYFLFISFLFFSICLSFIFFFFFLRQIWRSKVVCHWPVFTLVYILFRHSIQFRIVSILFRLVFFFLIISDRSMFIVGTIYLTERLQKVVVGFFPRYDRCCFMLNFVWRKLISLCFKKSCLF